MKRLLSIIAIAILLASCASKKTVSDGSSTPSISITKTQKAEQTEFLHRINNNHISALQARARISVVTANCQCDATL